MDPISEKSWQVYIIVCSDDSLYTGITINIERRLSQHKAGEGAKYFRGRQPVKVIYLESGHDWGTAVKRERRIKMMKHNEKLLLASSELNEIKDIT